MRPPQNPELPWVKFYSNFHRDGGNWGIPGRVDSDGSVSTSVDVSRMRGDWRFFLQNLVKPHIVVLIYDRTRGIKSPDSNPMEGRKIAIENYKLLDFARILQVDASGMVTLVDISIKQEGNKVYPKKQILLRAKLNCESVEKICKGLPKWLHYLAEKIAESYKIAKFGRSERRPTRYAVEKISRMAIKQCLAVA
jgi:hypothetical protein